MAGLASRARTALERHGASGLAREAIDRARPHVRLHEEHLWYELALAGASERVRSLDGLALRQAHPSDTALMGALDRDAAHTAEHVARGHDLWFVVDGETPAFSCFVYRGEAALLAARGGWMELPDATVCLEDSITAPGYRGRGLAPSAWSTLAAALEREGIASMITKVGVENAPSRKAVTKAGFVEVGLMRYDRWGPRSRVELEAYGDAPMARALRERLVR
jgi:L-amino acid N-acyltransferase YncA